MSLKAVRKKLKEQLEDDNDLQNMFKKFLIEKRPTPDQLDAITVRKTDSEERKEEFGSNYNVAATYHFEIVATMLEDNLEDGDDAQILSDQYIRQALGTSLDLSNTIGFLLIGKTHWGYGAQNQNKFYTIVSVQCKLDENPTDRD